MTKKHFLQVFLLLFPALVFSQFFNNTIIKTRPLQAVAGWNPSIGIEKIFNNKIFSIEADMIYKNRSWAFSGGEWDFGHFAQSDGVRLMAGARAYPGKKNMAPFGLFITGQAIYNYHLIQEIKKKDFHHEYIHTVRESKSWTALALAFGAQGRSKKITMEMYIGLNLRLYDKYSSKVVHSLIPEEIGLVDTFFNNTAYLLPCFGWTIGYHFNQPINTATSIP